MKNNNTGYTLADLDGVRSRSAQITTDLSKNQNPFTGFNPNETSAFIQPEVDASAHERLDVTHFMGNQMSFHVPELNPVVKLDVNKTVTEKPADPTTLIQDTAAVKADYIAANERIKTEMLESIEAVPNGGKELAGSIQKAMPGSGGSSAGAVAGLAIDQGVAGNAYAIASAINAQQRNRSIMSPEAAEILDKAMIGMRAANDQKAKAYRENPAMNQPPLDLSSLKTPKQMLNFLTRDVNEDPIMQEIAKNEKITNQMAENKDLYDNVYRQGKQKVTPEMAVAAAEAGDNELLVKLVGTPEKAELVKAGRVKEVFEPEVPRFSAGEATSFSGALRDTKLPLSKNDTTDLGAAARETIKSVFGNEPKMDQLTMKRDNNLSLTGV